MQDDLKQNLIGGPRQAPLVDNDGLVEQELPNENEESHPMLPLSLVLIDNQKNRREFNVNEIKLGRDNQSQIYYEDKSISRNHAAITRVGNSFFIRDESSSNGTYVKLFQNSQYLLVQNMMFDIPKIAELLVTNVGLMQVKIKVTSENEEESSKEFNLNLWGQQTWVVGRSQNQLVCENSENISYFEVQYFEIKQLGSKNVIRILHPDGFLSFLMLKPLNFSSIWDKVGSKDLKEIFKFYPLKKNDIVRIGDNVELLVGPDSVFEDYSADLCFLCKVKYPDSVEFVNLDCKHLSVCRVCRFTEFLCPQCSEPIKTWEQINNVVAFDDHDAF